MAEVPPLEYQVKASYLYNFTQFVDWPDDAFTESGRFHLCVIGAWRFGDALDALSGERVENRELTIRRIDSVSEARATRCHMLFVGAVGPAVIRAGVPIERGLLTVGESPSFLQRGGAINLTEVDGRIRFAVNRNVIEQAGLVVSSRLLRLALEQ